jgi:hypothetical protein
MSPLDVHAVLTGHCHAIKVVSTDLSGAMIFDLVATHPTNKLMGHAVGHAEEDCLVLSKPFRLEYPENMPTDHEGYDLVINDRSCMKN